MTALLGSLKYSLLNPSYTDQLQIFRADNNSCVGCNQVNVSADSDAVLLCPLTWDFKTCGADLLYLIHSRYPKSGTGFAFAVERCNLEKIICFAHVNDVVIADLIKSSDAFVQNNPVAF